MDGKVLLEAFLTGLNKGPGKSPFEDLMKAFEVSKPKTEGEISEKLKADLAAAPVASGIPVFRAAKEIPVATASLAPVLSDRSHEKIRQAVKLVNLPLGTSDTIISALNLRNAPFSGFRSKKHARHFLFTIFDTTNQEIKEKLRVLSVILAECM